MTRPRSGFEPTADPDAFRSQLETGLTLAYPPEELRKLAQEYNAEDDDADPIREEADRLLATGIDNREAYVDALADAFEEVLAE